MGNLSQNFDSSEFACHHCGAVIIDSGLVTALQELRDLIGLPIHINSGYRCAEHNKAVGGAPNSQHLLGRAADITVTGMDALELLAWAQRIDSLHGFGYYPQAGFVHVDVRPRRVTWGYLDGKYVSLKTAIEWKRQESPR